MATGIRIPGITSPAGEFIPRGGYGVGTPATSGTQELQPTQADFDIEGLIDQMWKIEPPKDAGQDTTYPYIAINPGTKKVYVNGFEFAENDATSALQSREYMNGPSKPPTTDQGWQRVSKEYYNQYLQSIEDPDVGTLFGKNVASGFASASEMLGYSLMLATGDTFGRGMVEKAQYDQGRLTPFQRQFSQIKNADDAVDFTVAAIAQTVPFMAETILSAIAGGIAGSAVAPGGGTAGGAIAGAAAKEAVKATLKQAVIKRFRGEILSQAETKILYQGVGAALGSTAYGYATGVGDVRSEQAAMGVEDAPGAEGSALLRGIPYALLNSVPEFAAGWAAFGKAAATGGVASRFAKGAAVGMALEGTSELGQEALIVGSAEALGAKYAEADKTVRWIDSFAAGALVGGAVGGPVNLLRPRAESKKNKPAPPTPSAPQPAPETPEAPEPRAAINIPASPYGDVSPIVDKLIAEPDPNAGMDASDPAVVEETRRRRMGEQVNVAAQVMGGRVPEILPIAPVMPGNTGPKQRDTGGLFDEVLPVQTPPIAETPYNPTPGQPSNTDEEALAALFARLAPAAGIEAQPAGPPAVEVGQKPLLTKKGEPTKAVEIAVGQGIENKNELAPRQLKALKKAMADFPEQFPVEAAREIADNKKNKGHVKVDPTDIDMATLRSKGNVIVLDVDVGGKTPLKLAYNEDKFGSPEAFAAAMKLPYDTIDTATYTRFPKKTGEAQQGERAMDYTPAPAPVTNTEERAAKRAARKKKKPDEPPPPAPETPVKKSLKAAAKQKKETKTDVPERSATPVADEKQASGSTGDGSPDTAGAKATRTLKRDTKQTAEPTGDKAEKEEPAGAASLEARVKKRVARKEAAEAAKKDALKTGQREQIIDQVAPEPKSLAKETRAAEKRKARRAELETLAKKMKFDLLEDAVITGDLDVDEELVYTKEYIIRLAEKDLEAAREFVADADQSAKGFMEAVAAAKAELKEKGVDLTGKKPGNKPRYSTTDDGPPELPPNVIPFQPKGKAPLTLAEALTTLAEAIGKLKQQSGTKPVDRRSLMKDPKIVDLLAKQAEIIRAKRDRGEAVPSSQLTFLYDAMTDGERQALGAEFEELMKLQIEVEQRRAELVSAEIERLQSSGDAYFKPGDLILHNKETKLRLPWEVRSIFVDENNLNRWGYVIYNHEVGSSLLLVSDPDSGVKSAATQNNWLPPNGNVGTAYRTAKENGTLDELLAKSKSIDEQKQELQAMLEAKGLQVGDKVFMVAAYMSDDNLVPGTIDRLDINSRGIARIVLKEKDSGLESYINYDYLPDRYLSRVHKLGIRGPVDPTGKYSLSAYDNVTPPDAFGRMKMRIAQLARTARKVGVKVYVYKNQIDMRVNNPELYERASRARQYELNSRVRGVEEAPAEFLPELPRDENGYIQDPDIAAIVDKLYEHADKFLVNPTPEQLRDMYFRGDGYAIKMMATRHGNIIAFSSKSVGEHIDAAALLGWTGDYGRGYWYVKDYAAMTPQEYAADAGRFLGPREEQWVVDTKVRGPARRGTSVSLEQTKEAIAAAKAAGDKTLERAERINLRELNRRRRGPALNDFDTVKAAGFSFGENEVIIFTDRIANDAHLDFVFSHEVSGHVGLAGIIGTENMATVMDIIYDSSPSIRAEVEARRVAHEEAGKTTPFSKAEAVEEVLADRQAQQIAAFENETLLAKVIRVIKEFFADMGVHKFEDHHVYMLLRNARQYTRTGKVKSRAFINSEIAAQVTRRSRNAPRFAQLVPETEVDETWYDERLGNPNTTLNQIARLVRAGMSNDAVLEQMRTRYGRSLKMSSLKVHMHTIRGHGVTLSYNAARSSKGVEKLILDSADALYERLGRTPETTEIRDELAANGHDVPVSNVSHRLSLLRQKYPDRKSIARTRGYNPGRYSLADPANDALLSAEVETALIKDPEAPLSDIADSVGLTVEDLITQINRIRDRYKQAGVTAPPAVASNRTTERKADGTGVRISRRAEIYMADNPNASGSELAAHLNISQAYGSVLSRRYGNPVKRARSAQERARVATELAEKNPDASLASIAAEVGLSPLAVRNTLKSALARLTERDPTAPVPAWLKPRRDDAVVVIADTLTSTYNLGNAPRYSLADPVEFGEVAGRMHAQDYSQGGRWSMPTALQDSLGFLSGLGTNLRDVMSRVLGEIKTMNFSARSNEGYQEGYNILNDTANLISQLRTKYNSMLEDLLHEADTKTVLDVSEMLQFTAITKLPKATDKMLKELGSFIKVVNGIVIVDVENFAKLKKLGRYTIEEFRQGIDVEYEDYVVGPDDKIVKKKFRHKIAAIPGLTEDSKLWQLYQKTRDAMDEAAIDRVKADYLAANGERKNVIRRLSAILNRTLTAADEKFVSDLDIRYREIAKENATENEDGSFSYKHEAIEKAEKLMGKFNAFVIHTKERAPPNTTEEDFAKEDAKRLKEFVDMFPEDKQAAMEAEIKRFRVGTTISNNMKYEAQRVISNMAVLELGKEDSELYAKRSIVGGYVPIGRQGAWQVRAVARDEDGTIVSIKDEFRRQLPYFQVADRHAAEQLAIRVNEVAGGELKIRVPVYDTETKKEVVKDVTVTFVAETSRQTPTADSRVNLNEFVRLLSRFGVNLTPAARERIVVGMTEQNARARSNLLRENVPGQDPNSIPYISQHLEALANISGRRQNQHRIDILLDERDRISQSMWYMDEDRLKKLAKRVADLKASPVATAAQVAAAQREYDAYHFAYVRTNGNIGLVRNMEMRIRQMKDDPAVSQDAIRKAESELEDYKKQHKLELGTGGGNKWKDKFVRDMSFLNEQKSIEYSDFAADGVAADIKTFTSVAQLGGSFATAALNLVSLPLNVLPALSFYNTRNAFGGGFGMGRSAAELTKALGQVGGLGKYKAGYYENLLTDPEALRREGLTVDEARFLADEILHGNLQAAASNALTASARGKFAGNARMQKFIDAYMSGFTYTEQASRRGAALAAYRMARERALVEGKDAQTASEIAAAFSADLIKQTLGQYAMFNRPAFFRGGIQQFVFMYKMYPITTVQLLSALPREGQAAMLLALWFTAGMKGMPFGEDILDLIDTILQMLGIKQGSAEGWLVSQANNLLPGSSPYVMRGVIDQVTPLTLSTRMSLGNMIPGTSALIAGSDPYREITEVLGPAYSAAEGAVQLGLNVTRGTAALVGMSDREVELSTLLRDNPVTLARAIGDVMTYMDTGAIVDSKGYIVSEDVSAGVLASRLLGFYPSEATHQNDIIRMGKRTADYQRAVSTEFRLRYVRAALAGRPDKVREVIQDVRDWNAAAAGTGLEIQNFTMNANRALREAKKSSVNRFEKSAPKTVRPLVEEYRDAYGVEE